MNDIYKPEEELSSYFHMLKRNYHMIVLKQSGQYKTFKY